MAGRRGGRGSRRARGSLRPVARSRSQAGQRFGYLSLSIKTHDDYSVVTPPGCGPPLTLPVVPVVQADAGRVIDELIFLRRADVITGRSSEDAFDVRLSHSDADAAGVLLADPGIGGANMDGFPPGAGLSRRESERRRKSGEVAPVIRGGNGKRRHEEGGPGEQEHAGQETSAGNVAAPASSLVVVQQAPFSPFPSSRATLTSSSG